jgi:hypothetical protein
MAYRFGPPETTTFAAIRGMSPTRQQQVLTTLQIRNGSHFPTMDACAVALPEEFDQDEESLTLERYDITREGDTKPAYEMWVYWSEHGIVFEHGSDVATAVHCVQCNFWSVDDEDSSAIALAEALNEDAPF